MVDVEMTIAIMKLLQERAPNVFEKSIASTDKQKNIEMLNKNIGKVIWHFTHFGEAKMTPLMPIIQSKDKSSFLAIDLSLDPSEWINQSPQKLAQQILYPMRRVFSILYENINNKDKLLTSLDEHKAYLSKSTYSAILKNIQNEYQNHDFKEKFSILKENLIANEKDSPIKLISASRSNYFFHKILQ